MTIAHSQNNAGEWHPLKNHILETTRLFRDFVEAWDIPEHYSEEFLQIPLLHDFGKYNPKFQEKLRTGSKSYLDHKFTGAKKALSLKNHAAVFCIAGHHGGLPDKDEARKSVGAEDYASFEANFLKDGFSFKTASGSITKETVLAWEMRIRFFFSALVDADYLDTETHFNKEKNEKRKAFALEANSLFQKTISFIKGKGQEKTTLNEVREGILQRCLTGAEKEPGFFSLTVPTGGGKTLSSIAFALKHAEIHKKRRVIIVLPFLTITQQTAQTCRDIFGDDIVLEHHSNAFIEDQGDEGEQETPVKKLLAENWDAPIIITTSVQFFDSLFANKPSKCRKLHQLPNSVVIFDEVQTLNPDFLEPTLNALRELRDRWKVTFLFCTATQPALSGDFLENHLEGVRELFGNEQEVNTLFQSLKRVEYELREEVELAEIASESGSYPCSLTIVNTKKDALELFSHLSKAHDPEGVYCLTTLQCPIHRLSIIDTVRKRLLRKLPTHVVSTQLIEAGVDIDFPVVYRAIAPWDSIIQAAGRCNREGRLPGMGKVILFRPRNGSRLPYAYAEAVNHTETMLRAGDRDFHDITLVKRYFGKLYTGRNSLDAKQIQDSRRALNFRNTARNYKVIDQETVAIFVPYGDGMDTLQGKWETIKHNPAVARRELRKLSQYQVALYEHDFKKIMQSLEPLMVVLPSGERETWAWVCPKAKYDKARGVLLNEVIEEEFFFGNP